MEIGTMRNLSMKKFAVTLAYLILLCIVAFVSAKKFMSNVPNATSLLPDVDNITYRMLDSFKNCLVCGCSHTEPNETYIIGDPVDPPNKYPWMVLLSLGNMSICSGAILDGSHILTAAHCLFRLPNCTEEQEFCKYKPKEIWIILLTPSSTPKYHMRVGHRVEEIFIHPQYKLRTPHDNDIAVLKMKAPIICDTFASPICLPPSNFGVPAKSMVTIAGWGNQFCFDFYEQQSDETKIPIPLLEAKVVVLNVSRCGLDQENGTGLHCVTGRKEYRNLKNGTLEPEGKPCFGDDGRPMFTKKKVFYLLGVASVQPLLCDPNATLIYTDVPKFMNYIQNVTGLQSAHKVEYQRKKGGKRSIKRRT